MAQKKKQHQEIIFSGNTILQGMPELAYVFDKEGKILMWNKNVELLLGYSKEELYLKDISDFIDEPDQEKTLQVVQQIFNQKNDQTVEHLLKTKSGEKIPYIGSGSCTIVNGKEYSIGMAINISRLKNTEEKLSKQIRKTNKLKTINMKNFFTLILAAVLMTSSSIFAQVTPNYNTKIPEKIMTPDKVETRIGDLEFYDGMPTTLTLEKVYDNLDFMRGVDVFLNFIPATSIEGLRLGMASIGADNSNKIVVMNNLMDANSLFLTGNASTVYASIFLDLETDGPTVVEVPAGAGPGTVNDAFFRFVVDMGAPGPDRKKGGMYIILPPDYKGNLKPTPNTFKDNSSVNIDVGGKMKNVWIAQSRSYTNWIILRGFLVDGKPETATKMWQDGLKVYPLADAAAPKANEFINGSGKPFNTIHANDYEFYEELASILTKEPISFIDPELRGQAAAIGIIKGKPFAPDARMEKILKEAVKVGNATARAIGLSPRDKKAYLYEDKQWYTGFVGKDYRWLDGDGNQGRNMDARTLFFYTATVNTPAMALEIPGVGSNYAFGTRDSKGHILLGEKNYKLNMPADVPAKDFWSIVVYDPQTRSMLQTEQDFPNKNSQKDPLVYNKDGSCDLYFGPKAPKDKEANWIQTVPNKAWFVLFRTYGPLETWFDKTWQLNDFELVK